jgi:flagellar protein FlaH
MTMKDTTQETKKAIISSGNPELDGKMGGGLPASSLTLIEGSSGAGKSVLSQQILWGSLQTGFTAALFTTENTVKSLVSQMQSIDLDILDYLLLGKFRVYPVELSRLGQQAPLALLQAMKQQGQDILVVDSFTSAARSSDAAQILSYFEECKRLCAAGTTILVVLHAHILDDELIGPIRSICDAHLHLRSEQDGQRIVKTLEVAKIRGAGSVTGAIVGFEVEPGWGMRVIPISKARG